MNDDFSHRSQGHLSLHCADSCMLEDFILNAQALKLGQQDLVGHCHHGCDCLAGIKVDLKRKEEEQIQHMLNRCCAHFQCRIPPQPSVQSAESQQAVPVLGEIMLSFRHGGGHRGFWSPTEQISAGKHCSIVARGSHAEMWPPAVSVHRHAMMRHCLLHVFKGILAICKDRQV